MKSKPFLSNGAQGRNAKIANFAYISMGVSRTARHAGPLIHKEDLVRTPHP